jgi:hypothetical protein
MVKLPQYLSQNPNEREGLEYILSFQEEWENSKRDNEEIKL